MEWTYATIWALMLALAAARVGGMLLVAPVVGERVVPARLRVALALVMSLAVVGRLAPVSELPTGSLSLAVGLGGQLLIGFAIGYMARLVFVGVEIGAFHISQQLGLSLAEVFNPIDPASGTAVRQFYSLLATVVFLAIGGHRMLIGGLLDSFEALPLSASLGPEHVLDIVTGMLGAVFALALKVAAPVLLALLLAGALLGFVQRTMPQLNILSVGLPVRLLFGLGAMLAGLMILPTLIQAAVSVMSRGISQVLEAV